jgi:RNA-directed DNA polymerase
VEKSGQIKCTFSGVQSSYYWSATTNANNTSNAWNVNLTNGNVNINDKTNTNYVWPVRSRK